MLSPRSSTFSSAALDLREARGFHSVFHHFNLKVDRERKARRRDG